MCYFSKMSSAPAKHSMLLSAIVSSCAHSAPAVLVAQPAWSAAAAELPAEEHHRGSQWRLAAAEVPQEAGVGIVAGEIVQCWSPTGVPNPRECSFTAPADGVYNFVWGMASSLSIIAVAPPAYVSIGPSVGTMWTGCCQGQPNGDCEWEPQLGQPARSLAVVEYDDTWCSGGDGYPGLSVRLHLRAGEGVVLLSLGEFLVESSTC